MPSRSAHGIELLADPTRRAIIALIAVGIRRPAEIAAAIGLSRPATSRQLRILADAGLIRWTWSRVDRRGRTYAIHPTMVGPITAWLAGVEVGLPPASRQHGWSGPRWRADPAIVIGDSGPDDDGSA